MTRRAEDIDAVVRAVLNSESAAQGKVFYTYMSDTNNDSSLNLGDEEPPMFATLREAVAYGCDQAVEHGIEGFVVECRAVRHVRRGAPVVQTIGRRS